MNNLFVFATRLIFIAFGFNGCSLFSGFSDGIFETKFKGGFSSRIDSAVLLADIYPVNDFVKKLQYPHSGYMGIDTLINTNTTEFILRKRFSCRSGVFEEECTSRRLGSNDTLYIKLIYNDSATLDFVQPLNGMVKVSDFDYLLTNINNELADK